MPSPELIVDLIRHSESDMNVAMADPNTPPFIGGRENHVGLSRLGELQASGLGHYAVEHTILPTVVYCSPAIRTKLTWQISSAVMGLSLEAQIDSRLQELDQGDWTNQPRSLYEEPANKRAMDEAGSDFAPPGGESINDVGKRMDDFFNSVSTPHATDPPSHLWIYTHGVAIKTWVGRRLCGWSHEQTYKTLIHNASLTRVVKQDGLWQPVFINQRTDR